MESEENRGRMVEGSVGEEREDHGSESGEMVRGCERREGDTLVGSYVGTDFSGFKGVFLGKIVAFDGGSRLYRVVYQDGRRENLDHREVCKILMADDGASNVKFRGRKRKLDQLVSSGDLKVPNTRSRKNAPGVSDGAQASSLSRLGSDLSEDADSSSNSCESVRAPPASTSSSEIQILQLPPSSGDISIPEESVGYLFSIYNFLRSFSRQLFLSPFGLDDFVGSLNCTVQNSLLDAIHVSLMRALKRHLEMLSAVADGSQLASKCLRLYDWTLLDTLTWPAFLVEYLYVMGYLKGMSRKGFRTDVLVGEYYGLPVVTKLEVLQILCDDVIESAELRTELEMRENMEEEKEHKLITSFSLDSRPMGVHPRYSKTSASEDVEALESSVQPNQPNLNSGVIDLDADASVNSLDGNNDECRLCGMDGTLICCDGCPSAYHTRCIGLNKTLLPDGLWLCPECSVNKIGPTSSRVPRGIRGAEVFGVDSFERVYLGTCNYLLVLETSQNVKQVSRYYNQDDVTKVLSALCSTGESASLYADICNGISKYWEVPLVTTQHGRTEALTDPLVKREPTMDSLSVSSAEKALNVLSKAERENYASNTTESSADNRAILCQKDDCIEVGINGSAVDSVDQSEFRDSKKYVVVKHDLSAKKTKEAVDETLFPVKNDLFASGNATLRAQKILPVVQTKFHEQLANESVVTDIFDSNHQLSAERFTLLDFGTCASGNEICAYREDAGSVVFPTKHESLSVSHESRQSSYIYGAKNRNKNDGSALVGAFFKPQAYMNRYILGDVAASAAANLAILASEDSRVCDAPVYSNPKKSIAASIALQVKAFSGAMMHFVWPSSEKKFAEVPRERCGWCIACKSAVTWKKGCLLNLAASNAIKATARNLAGLRPIKHNEGHLPAIAAYVLNMEESLHGLITGPFLGAKYNQQWRKLVREASTCRVLKFLLLELEKNIRGIALSGDWVKLVDDWSVELSAAQTGTWLIRPQNRGLGGRRKRKQSATSENTSGSSGESWKEFQWWRGGKLSKIVFQKGILPSSLVKKAARQGGCRRLYGICYSEGSELPRRNRQIAWRASLEMSNNISRLALQVRYLDAHVRWRDIVCPEQISTDTKGSDVEASAFKNAVICDRKIDGNKIRYALCFLNRKHLPLRVMKNIVVAEERHDEHDKLWLSENHVPLYLIKEYEERVEKQSMPSSERISLNCLPDFQRQQLKSWRKDIFLYLSHKGEKPSKYSCASCRQDVLLRNAVRCNACQGYCHKDCAISSTVGMEDDLEFLFTCNLCYTVESAAVKRNHKEISNDQLSSQGQEAQMVAGTKCMLLVGGHHSVQPVIKMEVQPEMRSSASGSNLEKIGKGRRVTYLTDGLIWKRRKGDESGKDFRLQNIILKNKDGVDPSIKPECVLCKKPYRPDLMYIRCEKCPNWFHADAVQLEEAQIFKLAGFKCGKCRRKSSPKCPYVDPDYRKPDVRPLKEGNAERNKSNFKQSLPVAISKMPRLTEPTTLVSHLKVEELVVEDHPVDPLGVVEPMAGLTPEPQVSLNASREVSGSRQKLPFKKPQVKCEMDMDMFIATPNSERPVFSENLQKLSVRRNIVKRETLTECNEFSATEEASVMISEKVSSPLVEWDASKIDGYCEEATNSIDFEGQFLDPDSGFIDDIEYEPQTYFSFTELLASSEDGQFDNLLDMPSSENCFPPIDFGDSGAIYQEDMPPCNPSGAHEMESVQTHGVANELAFDGLACQQCKFNQPSPDLFCEVCGLCIHSHCSLRVDSEVPSGDSRWRCEDCRIGAS